MADLNATQLANKLDLSKARISQYVSEGKLAGCYTGDGRARRFDLEKVAAALGKRLDLGQMTGNGLATRRALRDLAEDDVAPPTQSRQRDGELDREDPDRLELATIVIKEEEARKRRRDNAKEEGLWVLAEEVERHTARALSKEIGQFETVIRDGARAVADALGVDYRETRKILMDSWRNHRARRSSTLAEQATAARMSETEKTEQV